jgi:DNA-binding CsgD family transcriptional regulator
MQSDGPLGDEPLARLEVPTLILHPRDYAITNAAESMRAARVARGSFNLIDGSFALGDAEQGVRAIERFLADLPRHEPQAHQHADILSAREVEVLRLLAQGKSNARIAQELVISQNTVIRHVSNIFSKIGAENRAQAAVYARDHGIG